MKPGIYALISLDGAPLDPESLRALRMPEAGNPGVPAYAGQGIAVYLSDREGSALDVQLVEGAVVAFAGYLDEPEEMAARLGMSAERGPARLAYAALRRWGPRLAAEALGEWSFLCWETEERRLTLALSSARRDPVYFTQGHGWVAVAPDPVCLGRVPGVGLALDLLGLALVSGRNRVRRLLRDQTVWAGIREVGPGVQERFSAVDGRTTRPAVTENLPAERWRGSRADAVAMLDGVGRRILRQHLLRHGRSAFMLSGGLDSTLLTCWGALEGGAGGVFAVSSAAPPGSGLEDEGLWARAAAEALGVELVLAWPEPDWDLFCPPPEVFAVHAEPTLGSREPVYRALFEAALGGGAGAVFDGIYGEFTVSGDGPLAFGGRLQRLRQVFSPAAEEPAPEWPAEAFHPRFAPEFLASLPSEWKGSFEEPMAEMDYGTGVIGVHPAVRKADVTPTFTPSGLRRLTPYRDRRLLRAAAGLPAPWQRRGKEKRMLTRDLLRGRVPETVRLRRDRKPFSPDFEVRYASQAAAAETRVSEYQRAGLGQILNLPWLGRMLQAAEAGEVREYGLRYAIQQTAILAEFLIWQSTLSRDSVR